MPIIGHGDIASVLTDREDRIFFASGVSNSQETRESAYLREKTLLLAQEKIRHLVYFSSLSIFYSDTRYAQHKLEMETLVKANFPRYAIIRLGNITWGTNPHTIINSFRARIQKHEPLTIRDAYRYVVDKNEFLYWVSMIPPWSCEISITGQRLSIAQIVEKYGYD
jgi:nucleoside-diphosphate-sugar epimerase